MSYKIFLRDLTQKKKLCQLMLFVGGGLFFLALFLGIVSDSFSPKFWAYTMIVGAFPFGLGVRCLAKRIVGIAVLSAMSFCCFGGALLMLSTFDVYDIGSKIAFAFTGILRFIHNGILSSYLSWCLLGMGILFYILLR